MARADRLDLSIGREYIGDIDVSADPHQAVGRWWAHAILQGVFDVGRPDLRAFTRASEESRAVMQAAMDRILPRIGGFARQLTILSKEDGLQVVACDYDPDPVLLDAAALANMPQTSVRYFPWKSHTTIEGGRVLAVLGESDTQRFVWPPESVDPA